MREKAGLILPIFVITLAEAFNFSGYTEICLAFHALNIFVCILLPIWAEGRMLLFQSFALVSLIRVLNIGMPVFFTQTLLWMPFVYGPIVLAGYIVWRQTVVDAQRLDLKNLVRFMNGQGLRPLVSWRWEYILFAIIFGYIFSNLEFTILGNGALVNDLGPIDLTALFIVMIMFVGFGEELIFRALMQSAIEPVEGKVVAVFTSAVLFSVMHSGYRSLPYLAFVFVVGLLLAISYERTGSLGLVALMHGILNFFLFSFVPFGYDLLP